VGTGREVDCKARGWFPSQGAHHTVSACASVRPLCHAEPSVLTPRKCIREIAFRERRESTSQLACPPPVLVEIGLSGLGPTWARDGRKPRVHGTKVIRICSAAGIRSAGLEAVGLRPQRNIGDRSNLRGRHQLCCRTTECRARKIVFVGRSRRFDLDGLRGYDSPARSICR